MKPGSRLKHIDACVRLFYLKESIETHIIISPADPLVQGRKSVKLISPSFPFSYFSRPPLSPLVH